LSKGRKCAGYHEVKMISKKQLGIFFGDNSLSIVETEKQKLLNFFDAPHSLFDESKTSSQNIPDNIRLTAIIQKSLRDKKIETNAVNLSLPAKDIILRSFFIPWMTSSEVKGVVDFEARRYLPFKLEELVYGYYSKTVKEKKTRRIRILFVAVKKDVVQRYCEILEQASLKVNSIEAAVFSLLRVLSHKKKLPQNQRIAIIQMGKNDGTILVVDQGIPQFTRDFRLIAPGSQAFEFDPNSMNMRLLNEVRISLDYYRRQHASEGIDRIIFVTPNESVATTQILKEDLGIPVDSLNIHSLINLEEEVGVGVANAFGAGLRGSVTFPIDIDFAKELIKPEEKALEAEKIFEKAPLNYLSIVKVAAASLVILFLVFISFNRQVSAYQNKMNTLKNNQSAYATTKIEDINKKREEKVKKLEEYKNIPLKSDVAFLLSHIPTLLPKGTWLTTMSINLTDTDTSAKAYTFKGTTLESKPQNKTGINISIDTSGYTFDPDINKQIDLVNQIITNFKNSPKLAQAFQSINLTKANKQQIEDQTVTAFQIQCR